MPEYYLDIETYTAGEKPNPTNDRVITVQFQKLNSIDGSAIGPLTILTEWDSGSEKAMLEKFKKLFITKNPFDFVAVGANLYGFDLIVLNRRFNHYFDLGLGLESLVRRPSIDLMSTLIMHNKGLFKGWTDFFGKEMKGDRIKGWYEAKDWLKITDYIELEAKYFVEKYQILMKEIPKIVA